MNKHLILLFLVFLSLSSSAQHIRTGFKFGTQLSRPYYEDENFYREYKPKQSLGFNAGGVLNWKASDFFSLHVELLYNRVNKHLVGTDGYAVNKDQFDYLTAPVLLRGSVPLGHAEVYINAGPSINYWLGGKGFVRHTELIELEIYELDHRVQFSDQASDDYTSGTVNVTEANRFQLGLDVGTGAMIPMNGRYLMVDFRYSWGHTNMAGPEAQYLSNLLYYNDDLSFAHHSFSASVAYLFEFDLIKLTRKGKSKTTKGKGR